ncbi:hypothetical protein [Nonomuraea salmonea]|uniref:3-keto-disaccharide hydrolase domain-containing protein n=1 Tax=Nonomuraea salmonea TaxID=46181 RepID=A0ABV5NGJ4_9ACTN
MATSVRLRMWVNGEQVQHVEDQNAIRNDYLGIFARTTKNGSSLLKTTFNDFEFRGRPQP